MAYLKGSRVTGLSPKPIDVTGFTQSASEDLEGKYSQHEVLLADAFNVTDDVTISDNLILAKLSDDGNAITLTGNATTTRTISGSGSLEGSTFAQTPNASMTGMSGVVGSAVTNNAGVASGVISSAVTGTLGSGVTFPAGHVLQCLSKFWGEPLSSTSKASANSFTTFGDLWIAITPASGNKVLILVQTNISGSSYNDGQPNLALFRDSTKIGMGTSAGSRIPVSVGVPAFSSAFHAAVADNVSIHYLDDPSADGSTAFTYKIGLGVRGSGSATAYINRPPTDSNSAEHSRTSSSITVMEIKQ